MGGRWLSGLLAAAFALLIVGLGGWWFTLSIGVIVHLALLEFFRLAEFKGIRPAIKTTLVVCQLLLISTQLAPGSALAAAVLPLAGSVICGWLLLQPITGSIADIAASIFGLFYLGFLPSHWVRLRDLSDPLLAPHWPGHGGLAITLRPSPMRRQAFAEKPAMAASASAPASASGSAWRPAKPCASAWRIWRAVVGEQLPETAMMRSAFGSAGKLAAPAASAFTSA